MLTTTTQVKAEHMPRQDVEVAACPTIDDIEVSGALLAAKVREALRAATYVPDDQVGVEVRGHAVYLSGTVKWAHQRVAADRATEHLAGVHVLRNGIRVAPRVAASQVEAEIQAALADSGSACATRLVADVDDESVTLTGAVACYGDRRIAERAAQSLPHVRSVRNQLRIVRR